MTPLGGETVRIRGNGNADSLPVREPTGIPDSQQASGYEGVVVTGRGIIFLQVGNPAVYRGEERDTVRNNRRSVADRLPTPNATYMNVKFYI